jgi:CheY-like chemotaxis protein
MTTPEDTELRILVVDDEAKTAKFLKKVWEKQGL